MKNKLHINNERLLIDPTLTGDIKKMAMQKLANELANDYINDINYAKIHIMIWQMIRNANR